MYIGEYSEGKCTDLSDSELDAFSASSATVGALDSASKVAATSEAVIRLPHMNCRRPVCTHAMRSCTWTQAPFPPLTPL